MKPVDERVHELLDGELPPAEAQALRAELLGSPASRRDLVTIETAAGAMRAQPPLPEGFERRTMARIAARKAPRRGWLSALLAPRFHGEMSLATAGAFAVAAIALVGAAVFCGYRAGTTAARHHDDGMVTVAAAPASPQEKTLVRFSLKAPDARKVELAGSFNGWGSKGIELSPSAGGTWVASIELPKGHYEYTFVVDGERWVPDPSAGQLVDDGFGGHNAVIEL
jgi:anti-sigma factor RsiW